MRGRTKLVSLATVLAVLLTVSVVFASGLMDVSRVSLFSGPLVEPDSPGDPHISFDPATISHDYLLDPGYEIGKTFTVAVNIADVTDLFSYQVNVTWNPDILNFTGIDSYGDVLLMNTPPLGTSRIEHISVASNETGYAVIAETILGDESGVTNLVGGTLFTIGFEIVDYGWTELNIGELGILPTTLLDSTGTEVSVFTWTGGWFDNRIRGDSDGSGAVSIADMGEVSDRWTSPPGVKPYARFVDWEFNGAITIGDMGIVSDNWGRYVP